MALPTVVVCSRQASNAAPSKYGKSTSAADDDLSAGVDGHQVGKLRPHDYFIGAGGQHEVQTAPLVQFERDGHVQIGNLNLPGP